MINNINHTNPSFGATVNIEGFRGVIKNSKKIATELETATKDYPKDFLEISHDGKDTLKVYLEPETGMERTIEFNGDMAEKFIKDTKKSVESFIERAKICFDVLKYGAKRDEDIAKYVDILCKEGHIEEGGKVMDDIFYESWNNTKAKMYEKLSDYNDEILDNASIIG